MPLFNDEEKGKYEKAKYEKQQALIAFKRLEQKIILDVRDAVRTIDIKYRMLEASQKSRKAEAENYDAQDTRFRAGLVSTLDMRDYQERLARAEANLVKSEIDYNVALLDLSKAQGTMLIEDNIKIE
jgi:outer membrane protein TolC